jgi:hypothetical protein
MVEPNFDYKAVEGRVFEQMDLLIGNMFIAWRKAGNKGNLADYLKTPLTLPKASSRTRRHVSMSAYFHRLLHYVIRENMPRMSQHKFKNEMLKALILDMEMQLITKLKL